MGKNILLAVDTAAHDPARHVVAAADMTRELAHDSGDHVIVLHVHEFAVGRFGRLRIDCADGEGEGVVEKVVSDLRAAGVSTEGEITEANTGHVAAAILAAASITTRVSWCWARAAARICPACCWAAWPPGRCTWPPGRSSSCPGRIPPASRDGGPHRG